jgi:cytochrome c556
MRAWTAAAVAVCATVLTGLIARANEKPSDAFQQAMKAISAASAKLRADVTQIEKDGAYPDYNPIDADVAGLRAPLTVALQFWQEKRVDDAIAKTQAVMKYVDELETARKEKNYDSLMTAAAEIGKSCGGCHAAHREKLPDGSYEIK